MLVSVLIYCRPLIVKKMQAPSDSDKDLKMFQYNDDATRIPMVTEGAICGSSLNVEFTSEESDDSTSDIENEKAALGEEELSIELRHLKDKHAASV